MLEKRHAILGIFINDNYPRTILEISRKLGYKKPEAIRTALSRLHADGSLYRYEQHRPNDTMRFVYGLTARGGDEWRELEKLLYAKRFSGIR
jgi:DNA-binding transcriptional regulator PaaX